MTIIYFFQEIPVFVADNHNILLYLALLPSFFFKRLADVSRWWPPFSFSENSQFTCTMNKTDNIFTFQAICSFFAQSLLGRVYVLLLYLSTHALSSPAHRYDTGRPRTTSHPGSAQASFVLLLLLYSFFLCPPYPITVSANNKSFNSKYLSFSSRLSSSIENIILRSR